MTSASSPGTRETQPPDRPILLSARCRSYGHGRLPLQLTHHPNRSSQGIHRPPLHPCRFSHHPRRSTIPRSPFHVRNRKTRKSCQPQHRPGHARLGSLDYLALRPSPRLPPNGRGNNSRNLHLRPLHFHRLPDLFSYPSRLPTATLGYYGIPSPPLVLKSQLRCGNVYGPPSRVPLSKSNMELVPRSPRLSRRGPFYASRRLGHDLLLRERSSRCYDRRDHPTPHPSPTCPALRRLRSTA